MKFDTILATLKKLKSQLARSHGVKDLAVFGSVARDEAREDSDVDLLITFAPGVSHGLSFFGLQNLISERLGQRSIL